MSTNEALGRLVVVANTPALREALRVLPAAVDRAEREAATDVELTQVMTAWLDLLEANPDARHLGGPRSMALWDALDRLVEVAPEPDGQPG